MVIFDFLRRGRINPERFIKLKQHELEYIDQELKKHLSTHSLYQKLKQAISNNNYREIRRLAKELSREEHLGASLLEKIIEVETLREKDKKILAEDVLYMMADIVNEILPEARNAFIKFCRMSPWNDYVSSLMNGKSPIFFIDTSGIVRMMYYKGQLVIIHSENHPSKIPGKSVQEVWNQIKDRYNHRIRLLIETLGIE